MSLCRYVAMVGAKILKCSFFTNHQSKSKQVKAARLTQDTLVLGHSFRPFILFLCKARPESHTCFGRYSMCSSSMTFPFMYHVSLPSIEPKTLIIRLYNLNSRERIRQFGLASKSTKPAASVVRQLSVFSAFSGWILEVPLFRYGMKDSDTKMNVGQPSKKKTASWQA